MQVLISLLLVSLKIPSPILPHDLLEPFCLDELNSVFFVDFIDRYSFVLKSKEKVNELADLVSIISLFPFSLFQFSFHPRQFNEHIELLFRQHCLGRLYPDRLADLLLVGSHRHHMIHLFDLFFLLFELGLGELQLSLGFLEFLLSLGQLLLELALLVLRLLNSLVYAQLAVAV